MKKLHEYGVGFNVQKRLRKLIASAKARRIKINLDVNKYQILINCGCYFCGKDLKNENGYCLDRVDSSKGYIISNVVGCCKICNRAKSDMNVYDFIDWVYKSAIHLKQQQEKIDCFVNAGCSLEEYIELEERFYAEFSKGQPKMRVSNVGDY